MKISIGCDHAGFPYKSSVVAILHKSGHLVTDYGTHSLDSVDYPDFVHPVGKDLESGDADFGIVLCGSGNGVAITLNKYPDARCALCWNVELATLARSHNNANALALPVRFISKRMAMRIVRAFISQSFEGGRHANRVNKIKINC